jgi:hypothetical protein
MYCCDHPSTSLAARCPADALHLPPSPGDRCQQLAAKTKGPCTRKGASLHLPLNNLRQAETSVPPRTGSRWAEEPDFTLRQLVEDFAAEHGVAFLPKPGRSERGLQVTSLRRPWKCGHSKTTTHVHDPAEWFVTASVRSERMVLR